MLLAQTCIFADPQNIRSLQKKKENHIRLK